jgi:C-terminal processing protease CtpA/Prc
MFEKGLKNMLDRSFGWFQEKKEEALKRPIRSRMAAYGAIRSMLSSLNDPYTRFLLPDQGLACFHDSFPNLQSMM